MYCTKLTKEQLRTWGFEEPIFCPEETDKTKQWIITRLWRKNSSKAPVLKRISVTEARCRHKYSEDKVYLKITFSTDTKPKTITLARFIYCWFIGDLEEGEVVDHINNDSFDNRPENLQKLSVGENLAKRNIDNAKYARNQYEVEFAQLCKKLYEPETSLEQGKKLLADYFERRYSK